MENTENTQLSPFKKHLSNTIINSIFNKDGSVKNKKLYNYMGELMESDNQLKSK